MTLAAIQERLQLLAASPDVAEQQELLVQELRNSGAGLAAVRPILTFMEAHPDIDLALPGPLVRFVETFFGAGYEAELLASLARRPTTHTVWMLNRVINGMKAGAERQTMVLALEEATRHPGASLETRRRAAEFLKRLADKDYLGP